MKQLFEFFPLIIFFAVYYKSDKDLYLSIAAVIIATLISLAALYIKERKVSTMMLVSTIILVVFGGLSLFLKNDIFFKNVPPSKHPRHSSRLLLLPPRRLLQRALLRQTW